MARQHKFHTRQSPKNKQWYNTIKAPNGEIVFDGCEGYVKLKDAEAAVTKLVDAVKAGNFAVTKDDPFPVKGAKTAPVKKAAVAKTPAKAAPAAPVAPKSVVATQKAATKRATKKAVAVPGPTTAQ